MRKTVVDEDVVHEGVRPVAQIQSSRKQHGPDSICSGSMGTFSLSNGTGSVGSSDFNFIPSIFKNVMDVGATTKFTTTIESNFATRNIWFVVGNEGSEECMRW